MARPVCWKYVLYITLGVSIVILPLGSAGFLKYFGSLVGQPISLLILVPIVVGLLQYLIVPFLLFLSSGWMLVPCDPDTRCEPRRTLEHGLCCFRPDDGVLPNEMARIRQAVRDLEVEVTRLAAISGARILEKQVGGSVIVAAAPAAADWIPSQESAASKAAKGPSAHGPPRPHPWKLGIATFLGLYPSLLFAGFPASDGVVAAGGHPIGGLMVTILVAVLLVVGFTGPLMTRLLRVWIFDDESGEADALCCCHAGAVCCKRGVAPACGCSAAHSPAAAEPPAPANAQPADTGSGQRCATETKQDEEQSEEEGGSDTGRQGGAPVTSVRAGSTQIETGASQVALATAV